jgi:ABC-type lipoprotein release transport system permease subunit
MLQSLIKIGLAELSSRWRETGLMAGVVAVSLLAVLLLDAYRSGLEDRYRLGPSAYLVAQQSDTLGELHGSRLPASIVDQIQNQGVSHVVPEINTIIGTSPENALLLRGVPLNNYTLVETFRMISGRPLQPGDLPRLAMIGIGLSDTKGLGAGDTLTVRGRPFTIIGVFAVGTYADFETWIPLAEAQKLLGWGDDVSVVVFPAGEGLNPGESLSTGIDIVPRGQAALNVLDEWSPLFDLFGVVALTLGIAAALSLASMLWRLAWLRRRQLAILRSLGYRRLNLAFYLFVQSVGITLLAYTIALVGALIFTGASRIQSIGLTIDPNVNLAGAALALMVAVVIVIVASIVPAWRLAQLNLLELLRAE